MHHDAADGALADAAFLARQLGDTVGLQLERVSLGDVALKLLLVGVQRDSHLDLSGVGMGERPGGRHAY